MSPAARAAHDFASHGLAAIDMAIASAEEGFATLRNSLRDLNAGRTTLLSELAADAGEAAAERDAIVGLIKRVAAKHRPAGTAGRLDPIGEALVALVFAIERREHLAPPDGASPAAAIPRGGRASPVMTALDASEDRRG